MKNSRSQNLRSPKNPPVDLTSMLGFVKEKIPKPESCSLNRFAFELFFEFQRGDSVNILFTADDLEQAYSTIYEASREENLHDLTNILDLCFIYIFTDIIVGDGEQRAKLFLDHKKSTVSKELQENLIPKLYTIPADHIDSISEILEANVTATPKVFQPYFYIELNKFIQNNSLSPCVIFLLRRYFHNLEPVEETLHVTKIGRNRPLDEIIKDDCERPFLDEHKESTIIAQEQTQSSGRRHNANKQGQPSITQLLVPAYANYTSSDSITNTAFYSVQNELFSMNMKTEAKKIFTSSEEITAICVAPGAKQILVGDVIGNVYLLVAKEKQDQSSEIQSIEENLNEIDEIEQIKQISNRKTEQNGYIITQYLNCKSLITSLAFTPKLLKQFCVGTLNGCVYVFDSDNKVPLRCFALHRTGITSVIIHPNGEFIASSSVDGCVRIWSVTLATCVRIFNFTLKKPISMRFSHNGQLLLVVCSKGSLYIIDIGSGKQLKHIPIEAQLVDAEFSPSDSTIAVTDIIGGFSMWPMENSSSSGEPHFSLSIDGILPVQIKFMGMNEIRLTGFQKSSQ